MEASDVALRRGPKSWLLSRGFLSFVAKLNWHPIVLSHWKNIHTFTFTNERGCFGYWRIGLNTEVMIKV